MLKKIPLATLYPDEKFLLSRALSKINHDFDFSNMPTADFSGTLFVLPTQEAGRLFREKAALKFRMYGGVTSLKIILPEQLAVIQEKISVSTAETLEKWFEVLQKTDKTMFSSEILPDVEYTPATLLAYAEYLSKVRETVILESGTDVDSFADSLEKNSPLQLKLNEFMRLEEEYYKHLNNRNDKADVILNTLNSPFEYFKDIKKIILVECSEIRNAIAVLLEKLSENISVEHYLNATEDELKNFDSCGRPLTAKMLASHFDWDIEKTLRTFSNPVHEAMKIASFITPENIPSCIGVLSPGLGSSLTNILAAKNIEVSNPSKKPLNSFYWSKLFTHLLNLRTLNIPFDDIYFFASDESTVRYFEMEHDMLQLCSDLEKLQREHLIQDLDSLKFFINQDKKTYAICLAFCDKLTQLHDTIRALNEDGMPENLYNIFQAKLYLLLPHYK